MTDCSKYNAPDDSAVRDERSRSTSFSETNAHMLSFTTVTLELVTFRKLINEDSVQFSTASEL